METGCQEVRKLKKGWEPLLYMKEGNSVTYVGTKPYSAPIGTVARRAG